MFSVVSKDDTPVLPFIAQADSVAPKMDVRRVIAQCAGFQLPRFFSNEPAQSVRLAIALTTAILAQQQSKQAVIVQATAQQFTNHGAGLAEALQRGVQLARTGKVVELAASRPASASNAQEIRGVTGGYHLGEYREQAGSEYQGTGIFVFRADSFLVEAEILCGDMLALCRDSLNRGQISAPVSDGSLDSLATLSFWNGFWTRTDNRAAIVIGEQPETVSIPATGLATVERRRVQR